MRHPTLTDNVENNGKQRIEKRLGGASGRGFLPGKSGNPGGRPRSRGLLVALRSRVAEIEPDGRSIEEKLVNVLVEEGLHGKHRLAAVEVIFDRLEGRPTQRLDYSDISDDIRRRPTEELRFYLQYCIGPKTARSGP